MNVWIYISYLKVEFKQKKFSHSNEWKQITEWFKIKFLTDKYGS